MLDGETHSTDSRSAAGKEGGGQNEKERENCHGTEEQTEGDVASSRLGEAELASHQ